MSKTKKKLTYEEQEKLLDELSMKGSEEHKKYIDDETGEVRFRKTDNDYRLSVDNPECDIDKLNNDHLLRRKSQFCYLPGTNYYFLSYKHNCRGSDKNLHRLNGLEVCGVLIKLFKTLCTITVKLNTWMKFKI